MTGDTRMLAASLVPALRELCDGRMSEVSWFRTDWQRGGAATGYANYDLQESGSLPVVVKLPVVRREVLWLRQLQPPRLDADGNTGIVPRLLASGESIADYDLAWVVMERLPFGPLGLRWHDDHIPRIATAVASFYRGADAFPVDAPPRIEDWDQLTDLALQSIRVNKVEEESGWKAALKDLKSNLNAWVTEWRGRAVDHWIHGDLHAANAMTRSDAPDAPVTLIDFAEVRPGHWLEDAVYFERTMWARPERLQVAKPIKAIAEARRKADLAVEPNYPRLAMIRRALMAGTAPAFMKSEGSPTYLKACLMRLQQSIAGLR